MNVNEAITHLREMSKKCIEKMFDSAVENDPRAKAENMDNYIALNYAVVAMEKLNRSDDGDL